MEVNSMEEETQQAEQVFCASHTAFSFHQLQLPDEKVTNHF
jgi:hypothetical protein